MNKQYIEKLVDLAKEIIDLDKPIITNSAKAGRQEASYRDYKFIAKLNYLLGYIMALEERET